LDKIEKIIKQIEKGEELSPFLFIGQNSDLLNSRVEEMIFKIFINFDIPKINLIKLEDNWENIKIQEIKEFVKKWELGSPYKFQIFFLENISRLTLQSSNSCLKFFEEPWIQNIIFLTNSWENWILDTILSRVQIINLWLNKNIEQSNFYFNLLDNYLEKRNSEIFSYFFRNKLEKFEYIEFLKNLIIYSKKNFVLINLIEEIDEDINLIEKNNVNAKSIVDKYLLKI
jgi:DNA polymerase III delta prime subunit